MFLTHKKVPTQAPTINAEISVSSPRINQPIVSSLGKNALVSSPLVVEGSVPAGWMFEGTFPISITDSNHKLIYQTLATEKTPGSWQQEGSIPFIATLKFNTNSKEGFLVLQEDNPSGLLKNGETFELPVMFSSNKK